MTEMIQELTIQVPADYILPPIFEQLQPVEVSKLLTLGSVAYNSMIAAGQKINHESIYRNLKAEATSLYEPQLVTLQQSNATLKSSIESLQKRLAAEETFRLECDVRIREEERRNREELLKEKDYRIQSLEASLKQQLTAMESSFIQSSKSLTEGFQTFKQQIMRTATGSKTKGTSGESILADLVRKAYGSVDSKDFFDVTGTGEQGYCGDIAMQWKGVKVMWEAKSYGRNVDNKEVDKFKRDMEMNKEFVLGILISMETGIVGHTKAGDIDMEHLSDGRSLIYISNLNKQDDIIHYLQGIRPLLEVLIQRHKGLVKLKEESNDTTMIEDDSARVKQLEEKTSIILILVKNHMVTMTKFKNLMTIHKKKNEQMWLELTSELRESENQVRLMIETLIEESKVTKPNQEIPPYIFKYTDINQYADSHKRFISDCLDLFTFQDGQVTKTTEIKSLLGKRGWTDEQITQIREDVFVNDVWTKGKKEVKYFGIKV